MENNHFKLIFFFACAVAAFAMGLSLYVIAIDRQQIPMILTFWLSTGAAVSINYLIGNSVKGKAADASPSQGTTTADITASITTQPKDDTNG